ncbi:protein arginine N-methyltransferase 7-like [Eriocheir sinensis]|uniref:protein arginine N-methyltransferase 7-like n=1 Tax=Eriocheir sinensis TaxID=95602 RepID=UPI0021C5A882|nr:protein arginine N-methyltransferase 7-like [Eriocheir sinensis]
MSLFTQQLNPITGRREWGVMPEDYDYKQEVARSAYADMLHDRERNDKYYEGVRRAVACLRRRGQPVHALDIGTGTGLLSMMAVACGADTVTACEAFYPMAECARKGLAANGCGEKVRLIPKRSTELEVGLGKDMEQHANLLVAELFDTELIGEGAIDSYRHARDFLLTEDALLVPWEGVVYAQVVDSDMLQRWNRVTPITRQTPSGGEEVVMSVPPSVQQCPGAAAVHDLQLSQVPRSWFTPLSEPLPVFRFDWGGRRRDLPTDEVTRVSFEALRGGGRCDAVLMWWEVTFDPEGEVTLSCAPYWAHPDLAGQGHQGGSADIPWRDHWMQAVYYLPTSPRAAPGEAMTLVSAHDEYSLWFNVKRPQGDPISLERPVCECGLHIINARTRLGQLNDPRRRAVFLRVLERVIDKDSVVLALGDGCLMGVAAAKMGARHVYLTEGSEAGRRVMAQFIAANQVGDRVTILNEDISDTPLADLVAPINLVFSEPFFSTSLLPWHALYCWYARNSCLHLLGPSPHLLPGRLTLWGLPVRYRDLWKIRAPLRECNGFTMDVFDELIETACREADDPIEPQPLWEYPAEARGAPLPLLTLDLAPRSLPPSPVTHAASALLPPGEVNGMALWADWHLTNDDGDVVTTGPVETVMLGEEVCWDVHSRQGVYLFPSPHRLEEGQHHALYHTTTFLPHDGTMAFTFRIETVPDSTTITTTSNSTTNTTITNSTLTNSAPSNSGSSNSPTTNSATSNTLTTNSNHAAEDSTPATNTTRGAVESTTNSTHHATNSVPPLSSNSTAHSTSSASNCALSTSNTTTTTTTSTTTTTTLMNGDDLVD